MKNSTLSVVIRLGDTTDHDGVVTSADSSMTVHGKPVATEGSMTGWGMLGLFQPFMDSDL